MLYDDFNMYYSGTYVGIKTLEGVKPFYVDNVYHDSGVIDFDDMSRSERAEMEFSPEAEAALVFSGSVVESGSGVTSTRDVPFTSEDLILDLPDSKYVIHGGIPYWVTYSSCRSTKKGITDRKLKGYSSFNSRFMHSFYSQQEDTRIVNGVFFKRDNGDFDYKGIKIGTYTDGSVLEVSLFNEAEYLIPHIQAGVNGQCHIVMAE